MTNLFFRDFLYSSKEEQCIHKETGKKVTFFAVPKSQLIDLQDIKKQLHILLINSQNLPNVIKHEELIETPNFLIIITEPRKSQKMYPRILELPEFSEKTVAELVKKMLLAMQQCYSVGIPYLNLHPDKFWLQLEPLQVSINPRLLIHEPLWPGFMAHETIISSERDHDNDIWNLGIIAYELLSGLVPFHGQTQKDLFDRFLNLKFDFPTENFKDISEEAIDFIKKLLVLKESRLSLESCLQHSWIRMLECSQWETQYHKLFPIEIQRQIRTMLTLSLKDTKSGNPLFPTVQIYRLPKEILFHIFSILSKDCIPNYATTINTFHLQRLINSRSDIGF